MADRPCRNFQPNVFNKSKCQNCFKLREAHGSSGSSQDAPFQSLTRKQSAQKVALISQALCSLEKVNSNIFAVCLSYISSLNLLTSFLQCSQFMMVTITSLYTAVRYIQDCELW